MRRLKNGLAIAAMTAVGVATGVAGAQEGVRNEQATSELRGDWVIGATVTSPDGETIGTISDILIDSEDGGITGAVVDVGGFLGFGAKSIVVDWEELEQDHDANEVTLDLDRQEAEEAPDFAFRERETPPPPEPTGGTGGTGDGMGGNGEGTGGGMGDGG
ncbi:MAG: PRC-barrel domain-containing protein [Alphaproteobacteria bacterium]